MGAAELARDLGVTQSNASYHLRKLAGAAEVVEVGDEQIRGGVAKRYRYLRHCANPRSVGSSRAARCPSSAARW
ncbi:MAG: helix-turn-helix domain-containing protein [Nocardioidaceae bacterium]